jgi:hypothetical protein
MKLAAMQALHQRHWPQRFAAANAFFGRFSYQTDHRSAYQVYSAPKNPPS